MWIRGYPGIFNIKPSNPKIHGLLFCFCTICFMLNQTILRSILFLIFYPSVGMQKRVISNDVTPKNNNWHSTQVTHTDTHISHHGARGQFIFLLFDVCSFHVQIMEVQVIHMEVYCNQIKYCHLLDKK